MAGLRHPLVDGGAVAETKPSGAAGHSCRADRATPCGPVAPGAYTAASEGGGPWLQLARACPKPSSSPSGADRVPRVGSPSEGASFRQCGPPDLCACQPAEGTAAASRGIRARRTVLALGTVRVHHPLDGGRTTMATSAERMRALRERLAADFGDSRLA